MKLFRLAALAAAVSLAACTSSPTDSATTAPTPSFDGGGGIGTGNYHDDGIRDGGTAVPTDTVARGPGMLGSGN
ncbi:MAG TPA: hypothetical protein VE871_07720 [Longimicrobium sp.]|nr:hypothetical protein [Longimicrobium sp.]